MSGGGGVEYSDHAILLRSNSSTSEGDLESQGHRKSNKGLADLLKRLDRGFSGRRLSIKLAVMTSSAIALRQNGRCCSCM
ncbi:hypothetical protein CsSME_00025920 [Camellia sinensis var. sinensis]